VPITNLAAPPEDRVDALESLTPSLSRATASELRTAAALNLAAANSFAETDVVRVAFDLKELDDSSRAVELASSVCCERSRICVCRFADETVVKAAELTHRAGCTLKLAVEVVLSVELDLSTTNVINAADEPLCRVASVLKRTPTRRLAVDVVDSRASARRPEPD
jgi:hypothetical protein